MLTGGWVYVAALAASFVIATVATPAGVSGAVLLLPFQVGVLGTPSPAVTPTNLLYNVVATPGAIYRYWRQGQTGGHLTRLLIAGTLPGVIAGSIVRVEVLPGPRAFDAVIAAVPVPLGGWLILQTTSLAWTDTSLVRFSPVAISLIAAAVGCVGGIYGIGGGSILAPLLVGSGRSATEVAPATLAAIVGIVLTAITALMEPPLGIVKRRIGAKLESSATAGEGTQNLLCSYLALAVLAGLLANTLLGLWWLDSIVALGIATWAVVEGHRAWAGESCSCGPACPPMTPTR